MLRVMTTCTPDYPRSWIFPSLGFLTCRAVCLLDPSDHRPLPTGVGRIHYKTPGVLYQDGRFLDAVCGLSPDDLVVMVDADAVFQRDFTQEELDVLNDLSGGVAMGYNARPGQRGAEEYEMLRPRQPIEEAAEHLHLPVETLQGAWIYNTGFLVARVGTWRRIRHLYQVTFLDRGPGLFQLHSWPQYFICMLLQENGIPVTELGYETHSHGHLPLTPRHSITNRKLHYDGQLVLYAHCCAGVTH